MSTSARYSTERHNGNINNIEYENISSVSVQKGADSVMYGSGALGGAVVFTTKEIEDFVDPDRTFGFLSKTGYTSKNREWREVIGGGVKGEHFFGFAQLTKRWGHKPSITVKVQIFLGNIAVNLIRSIIILHRG